MKESAIQGVSGMAIALSVSENLLPFTWHLINMYTCRFLLK